MHEAARLAEHTVLGVEGGAERAAAVARRRLDEDFSNGVSLTTRPLATLLSATPPARQRSSSPVSSCRLRAMASTISSVTCWMLAATSA